MKILKIEDSQEKGQICERVLRALPAWFGIESAILDYIKDVQNMETWIAQDSDVVGFLSLNKHNSDTAEIHVMGVLPKFHGQKLGTKLLTAAEKSLASQGFKYLSVKTLSPSRPDVNYDQTRKFYLESGFIAIEEFKNLWGEHNPCLMLIKPLPAQHYAVVFSSRRNDNDHQGYEQAANQMIELSKTQKGFLGVESARDAHGFGITVSYWASLEDIRAWKANTDHQKVQAQGRSHWYDSFSTRICRVEREYHVNKGSRNE